MLSVLRLRLIKHPLHRAGDHVADRKLDTKRDLSGRNLRVGRVPREFARLPDLKEARCGRRVVVKAVKRVFAGVEAVAARLDLTLNGVGLADLKLEASARQVAIKALVRCDEGLIGLIGHNWRSRLRRLGAGFGHCQAAFAM